MTISATFNDTYTMENGEKKPIDINSILHDIRTKFTDHVSRSDRANTLNIYNDTIKLISEILEANNLEVSENIKDFLLNHSQNENINFYSDEMNQTSNISYNSNKAQNKEKSQHYKDLLIDSFNGLIETIKNDYKANSYRSRNLPNNFKNFIGQGGIWFGANEEMRALRDEKYKELKGLTEEESEYFNSLDDNEIQERVDLFLKEVEEKYGVKILYSTIHNDEKTKHIHFTYSSYNFDEHKVFKSGMSKFDLKKRGVEIQDLIYDSFKDMNMPLYKDKKFNLSRGIERTHSVKNLSMSQMQQEKIKEQAKILEIQNQSIEENESKIEESYNAKNELENIIDNLRSEKDEVDLDLKSTKVYRDEVKNDLTLSKEQKKSLYSEISEVQKALRTKRKELVRVEKDVKNLKDLDTSLKKDTLEILNDSKTLLSFDESKLKKAIYKKIKEYSRIDLKAKEIDDLKQDKVILIEQVSKLNKDIEKKDSKIRDLEEISDEKSHEIKRLRQRDKDNANFTKSEIVEATISYENEISDLKNELKQEKKEKEVLKSNQEKSKDLLEFVQENHKEIIEDFEEQKKNRYLRHR